MDGPSSDGAAGADSPIAGCKPGFLDLCAEPAPTEALILGASVIIDTDSDVRCRVKTQASAPDICALIFTRIEVPAGLLLTVRGSRAVALVASEELVIRGGIDAAARFDARYGARPAGSLLSCLHASAAESDAGGGAGGAGGSFGGRGGNGGLGDNDKSTGADGDALGGTSGAAVPLTALRGGCAGQTGGSNEGIDDGQGGRGGGAVYLAAPRISITGSINVSGSGGGGGTYSGGRETGGGGGGSGGAVVMEGAVVAISGASLFATGGGGGGGSSPSRFGMSGADGGSTTAAPGGPGGGAGGMGGTGAAVADGMIGTSSGTGAGGGGGGVGYLLIISRNATVSNVTAAPALQTLPPAP